MLEGTDRELERKVRHFCLYYGWHASLKRNKRIDYPSGAGWAIVEDKGLTCLIANAGYFGVPGLHLDPEVKVDDGLLDVFVIQKTDLVGLFSLAASVVGGTEKKDCCSALAGKKC